MEFKLSDKQKDQLVLKMPKESPKGLQEDTDKIDRYCGNFILSEK